MASGLAATTLANKWLNMLGGTAFTAPSTFVQLHTGEPGAAGSSNVSSVTTRPAITWAAASAGPLPLPRRLPPRPDRGGRHGERAYQLSRWEARRHSYIPLRRPARPRHTDHTHDT